ncbi:hypothetical protein TWF569_010856 [Orbilia oligospora]|uniref:Uncharacterized protein n=1 Tax=Orbilia oligospora TaxID=2813651 RepID=A0A7C8NP67_ORBOL|nr:hypothetical protein TWF103_001299 [Orbilia oligospora]KAF3091566.1 hypothetical protein TWF706_009540 [Orbilia oligospora]KAF3098195.1 hypothetical protein TWF102_006183 [Orbilia oligospora]KAF3132574.1 hypothetical protein TWF569_010856 [Orbilia oligospora]
MGERTSSNFYSIMAFTQTPRARQGRSVKLQRVQWHSLPRRGEQIFKNCSRNTATVYTLLNGFLSTPSGSVARGTCILLQSNALQSRFPRTRSRFIGLHVQISQLQ